MDADDQNPLTQSAALLLIIGEPFSEEQKTLILAEITKGFKCWDVEDTGININEELATIANAASLGEEGVNGERIIQHQSENLAVEILINPLAQTVKNSTKKLLIASSPTKYIIYAGHAFKGSGAWVLQDDTFAFGSLAQIFKNVDVENALKQNIEASLTIHTLADNNWGTSISKADFTNNLRIQLNPPVKLDNIHGVLQFTAYVGSFVKVVPITSLLQASEQFGNISFTRPTLYIFPGCQGDSALFGVNGFNLLVNGGYNRRACFWDFARHLDRVDAVLMTHLGTDNVFGLSTVLQRKSLENIHPQIGYLYFNALDKLPVNTDENEKDNKNDTLLFNLAEEANKITQLSKQLGISPHPCSRGATSATSEPVNLYHKLGHGSLDMYILNPVTDSKELKEFFQQWQKQSSDLGSSGPFPLQNALSVCTLLVWKPYNFDEKIVRIFFPGNAPQHKVIEGLEKMKTFGFLKHASCTTRDLMKPAVTKKATSGSARPGSGTSRGSARTTASARSDTSRGGVTSPRKTTSATATRAEAKPTSPTKPTRPTVRESVTKKNDKPLDKSKTDDRTARAKPSSLRDDSKMKSGRPASAASSGSRTATSPRKTPSPAKAMSPTKSPSPPKTTSPPKSPTKAKSPAKQPAEAVPPTVKQPVEAAPPAEAAAAPAPLIDTAGGEPAPALNHVDQSGLKAEADQGQASQQDQVEVPHSLNSADSAAPDGLPEPVVPAADDSSSVDASFVSGGVDKQKLEELGIFEEKQKHQPNGDSYEAEDEEIKPQALPEPPVIIESPSQDSDNVPDYHDKDTLELEEQKHTDHSKVEESCGMPDYSSKMESDERELSEFSKAEEELHGLNVNTENLFTDPAQEIPPSPEPVLEEHHDHQFPSTLDPPGGFDTPVFSHDEPEPAFSSVEHNIQYGIDDLSRGRDMGGIQEVDEEEEEKDEDTNRHRLNEYEREKCHDEEMLTASNSTKHYLDPEDDEEGVRDTRISAERQFEDADDESSAHAVQECADEDFGNNSSLPAAFDRDSSPDFDKDSQTYDKETAEYTNGDKDSIDGEAPDDDKDVDETAQELNGHGNEMACENVNLPQKSAIGSPMNPFIGVDSSEQVNQFNTYESDDEVKGENFDPVAQWGQPMGLPSPPPLSSPTKASASKSKSSTSTVRSARNGTSSEDSKRRTGTAPSSARNTSRPGTASKRPGSSRSSPSSSKIPPLPPMTPFYVDLTYIPNHGNPSYSDAEFFKRVRARYYVVSALSPNPQVLDSLMEAKATWEQKDLEVTLIPTYDNETLRHWMGLNKEKLQELRIDMTPAVSRCTIQLQDLETSLPAYRLEV